MIYLFYVLILMRLIYQHSYYQKKKDRDLRDIPLCVQLSPVPAPHPALPTDCLPVMGLIPPALELRQMDCLGAHTGFSGPIHQEEQHFFSCLYYRIRDATISIAILQGLPFSEHSHLNC